MAVGEEDSDAFWSRVPADDLVFLEIFAGKAVLSKHVRAKGVPVLTPNEVNAGGTDFCDPAAVAKLKAGCLAILTSGLHLLIHMAPSMLDLQPGKGPLSSDPASLVRGTTGGFGKPSDYGG